MSTELEWIGKSEAGRILGVSSQRVYQLAVQGRIPSVRTSMGQIFKRELITKIAAYREARSSDLAGNSPRNWPDWW